MSAVRPSETKKSREMLVDGFFCAAGAWHEARAARAVSARKRRRFIEPTLRSACRLRLRVPEGRFGVLRGPGKPAALDRREPLERLPGEGSRASSSLNSPPGRGLAVAEGSYGIAAVVGQGDRGRALAFGLGDVRCCRLSGSIPEDHDIASGQLVLYDAARVSEIRDAVRPRLVIDLEPEDRLLRGQRRADLAPRSERGL